MNKNEAIKFIEETFEKPFNRDRFGIFIQKFLKNIKNDTFLYSGNLIKDSFKDFISKMERIGKFSDDKNEIDILIVNLKKESSIYRARSAQRNYIAQYLSCSRGGKLKDAALVAFVSPNEDDWRFSLVKMEYRLEKSDSGKIKAKEEFSPAKRWSFLVGKNEKSHTAKSRFLKFIEDEHCIPTFKDLEEAFNAEVVTNEFFKEYRDLFIRTKLQLDEILKKDEKLKKEFEKKNINTVDFTKKFLGQIVFLYFLQKKGWFGVEKGKGWGSGPKDFLRRLFNKEFCPYNNFFNDILEPLFYEALRTDRSSDDHFYSRFKCKIPFLNGGLFDPINNYDWVNTEIVIPNDLFSNQNKTKEGDIGDGILDVFDRYNFTVNEEEPLDKEVALDPELLGKIYEKLNAIRQDNFDEYLRVIKSGRRGEETKFNKKYAVYYTPRKIVNYMCQKSLIYYLHSEINEKIKKEGIKPPTQQRITGEKVPAQLKFQIKDEIIKKDEIEKFVKEAPFVLENEERVFREGKETKDYYYKIPLSIRDNAELIDKLLSNIKICDPAVGSGAFPVGMMNLIVNLRKLLSVYMNRKIKDYDLKRECIENSLYGVDIDLGAVEICKLRFWLSMIVDEEDFYNIKPLPNLDYKVVCGDSLLGFPENWGSPIEEDIESLMEQYFKETNPLKKQKIKKEIDNKINQRIEQSEKNFGYKINFDFKLFFPRVFREKGGFDIVIANPPYIKEYVNRKAFDGKRNSPYYQGKMDIWYIFVCKGIDLLKKNEGILTFIAQNNWITSYGASKMRNKVIKDTQIIQLLDFGSYMIFESSNIQTMIMIFRSDSKSDNYKFDYRKLEGNNLNFNDVMDLLNYNYNSKAIYLEPTIKRNKFLNKPLTFSDIIIDAVLNKVLEQYNFKLTEDDVAQGIVAPQEYVIKNHLKKIPYLTLGDGIFVLSDGEKNNISFTKKELELIKPFYTTKELRRYYANRKNSKWIIYTDSKFKYPENIKPYPNIKRHLDKFQKVITSDNKPYGLHRARDEYFFKGEKIIAVRKCIKPTFTYTDFDCYVSATFYVIKTKRINLKYLTALLNSKLIAFWLKHKGKMQGNNYQIDKEPLLALPLKSIRDSDQKPFIALVDKILAITEDEDYFDNPFKQAKFKEYERQIDQLVYELYGLTEKEIEIVEGK